MPQDVPLTEGLGIGRAGAALGRQAVALGVRMPGTRSMALVTPHDARLRPEAKLGEVLLMTLSGGERSSVLERIKFNLGAIKEKL